VCRKTGIHVGIKFDLKRDSSIFAVWKFIIPLNMEYNTVIRGAQKFFASEVMEKNNLLLF
jgi:hypothetical protein